MLVGALQRTNCLRSKALVLYWRRWSSVGLELEEGVRM